MKVGSNTLDLTTPVVMAIVNVTPDSFWEGSRRLTDDQIAASVDRAVGDGAGIIDIGGYSSRPGADDVTPDEEYRRVAQALEIVRKRHPQAVVSVDTFRACVARRAVEEYGPCIINDISAGDLDPQMIPAVAALGVPYIAMHMRANPATMQQYTDYDDVTDAVKAYLLAKVRELEQAGVGDIIIDPGFGFAKSTRQNYQLLSRLDELTETGYPLLSGVSRKSMIYKVLGSTPAESLAGTAALNWESLRKGAAILRVHDVREAADIVKLYTYYKDTYAQ